MKLKFVKMNPAGNTTIFILDHVASDKHLKIASTLMQSDSLCADQVGFIEEPHLNGALVRLQMMGGEFCGNAARALAALIAEGNSFGNIRQNMENRSREQFLIPLEVSGFNEVLETKAYYIQGIRVIWAETPIPLPAEIEKVRLNIGSKRRQATFVKFPGITHCILEEIKPDEQLYYEIRKTAGPVDALGVMFYEPKRCYMVPLVGVDQSKPPVWEGSCGSGTAALAIAITLGNRHSINDFELAQPGGKICVDIDYSGGMPVNIRIKGPVYKVAEGLVWVDI